MIEQEKSNISEDEYNDLYNIFNETLRLYIFLNDLGYLESFDYECIQNFIYKYKHEGLAHFDYIAGLYSKKDYFTAKYEAIIKFSSFLSEENRRTEVNEFIADLKRDYSNISKEKIFIDIDNDLELVNNGEKSWYWFYNKYENFFTDEYINSIPRLPFFRE